jgi:hypothetical protein
MNVTKIRIGIARLVEILVGSRGTRLAIIWALFLTVMVGSVQNAKSPKYTAGKVISKNNMRLLKIICFFLILPFALLIQREYIRWEREI